MALVPLHDEFPSSVCQCATYHHPYTGKPTGWASFLRALFLPACILGENETQLVSESVISSPLCCGAAVGPAGKRSVACACCASTTCCLPILWFMSCRQRRAIISKHAIHGACTGSMASACVATCCLPCSLHQTKVFLDERKHEGRFYKGWDAVDVFKSDTFGPGGISSAPPSLRAARNPPSISPPHLQTMLADDVCSPCPAISPYLTERSNESNLLRDGSFCPYHRSSTTSFVSMTSSIPHNAPGAMRYSSEVPHGQALTTAPPRVCMDPRSNRSSSTFSASVSSSTSSATSSKPPTPSPLPSLVRSLYHAHRTPTYTPPQAEPRSRPVADLEPLHITGRRDPPCSPLQIFPLSGPSGNTPSNPSDSSSITSHPPDSTSTQRSPEIQEAALRGAPGGRLIESWDPRASTLTGFAPSPACTPIPRRPVPSCPEHTNVFLATPAAEATPTSLSSSNPSTLAGASAATSSGSSSGGGSNESASPSRHHAERPSECFDAPDDASLTSAESVPHLEDVEYIPQTMFCTTACPSVPGTEGTPKSSPESIGYWTPNIDGLEQTFKAFGNPLSDEDKRGDGGGGAGGPVMHVMAQYDEMGAPFEMWQGVQQPAKRDVQDISKRSIRTFEDAVRDLGVSVPPSNTEHLDIAKIVAAHNNQALEAHNSPSSPVSSLEQAPSIMSDLSF